ncbi:hypothetical protein DFH08DRAFT_800111 [Mycena albidolilacea]|uniref:Uncharacterized protein n=1 Tax=Mycena albidolilacea TaxID=1033008 RepID=A0AAD7EZ63_9AGAR|nr:hypothetical protein DFH08DRAFT_800111 [Mycena albidolilacea]
MGFIAPPPESNTSNYSTVVNTTDGRCAVSRETNHLQSCHLVPEAEVKWRHIRTHAKPPRDQFPAKLCATTSTHKVWVSEIFFAPYAGMTVSHIHQINVHAFTWGLFHASQNILHELKKTQGILTVVEQTTVSVSAIPPTKRRRTEGSGGTNDGPKEQESRTDVDDEAPLLTDGDRSSDDAAPQVSLGCFCLNKT